MYSIHIWTKETTNIWHPNIILTAQSKYTLYEKLKDYILMYNLPSEEIFDIIENLIINDTLVNYPKINELYSCKFINKVLTPQKDKVDQLLADLN